MAATRTGRRCPAIDMCVLSLAKEVYINKFLMMDKVVRKIALKWLLLKAVEQTSDLGTKPTFLENIKMLVFGPRAIMYT